MVLMLVLVLVIMVMMVMAMMMQPRTQALLCTLSCLLGKANMSFPSGQVMLMLIDGVCGNNNNGVRNGAFDVGNMLFTLMRMVIIVSLLAMLFMMMFSMIINLNS